MRKYIIIAAAGIAVIGLVAGVILVLRQRSGVSEEPARQPSAQTSQTGGGGTKPQSPQPAEQAGGNSNTAAPAGPVCGDYKCEQGETAANCPQDCVLAEPGDIMAHLNIVYTGESGAEMSWETNVPTTGILEYGLTKDFELGKLDDGKEFKTVHKLTLPNIKQHQSVYFEITIRDQGGTEKVIKEGLFGND